MKALSLVSVAKCLLLMGVVMMLLSLSGCFLSDPRKNCNHPQHEKYIMEKRMKQQGF
jgi:hypothetical protein